MATSVGGAAASGLESGFSMGLRATAANEARQQREFENARQTEADKQRADQLARSNSRQDKQDVYAEDDRALSGVNSEMSDHAVYGAGLAAQYGGPSKIPGELGNAYATKANEIGSRRAALLKKRYAPQVDAEKQWANDTSSRIATGQLSMDDLSPADTVRLLQATTRRPVGDFLAPTDGRGKSKVKQAIDDTTAGIETKNQNLTMQGAGALLAPDLQTGIGHVTPDGAQITGKSLYALVPAPARGMAPGQQNPIAANPIQGLTAALTAATAPAQQAQQAQQTQQSDPNAPQSPQNLQQPAGSGTIAPSQGSAGMALAPATGGGNEGQVAPSAPAALAPGSDPDMLMPVLQVTAQHPDGTEVTYHAPVTRGRGTGADDEVHPGFKMSDAMDRMGKLGTLEAWANTPAARAKIAQGLKDLGGDANSFLGAYYAMHGDAKALLPAGATDPTSQKIAAIQKLADKQNITFEEAARQIDGKGSKLGTLAQKFTDIDDSDLSPDDKAEAKRVAALGVKQAAVPGTLAAPRTSAGVAGGIDTKVAPAAQAARDSDAVKVLQTERGAIQSRLNAATTPEAKARAQGDLTAIDKEIAKAGKGTAPSIAVKHGAAGLSTEQNDALFGPKGAVTEGRLDMNRINSRTAGLLADAEITNPGTDFAKKSGDIQLGRNAGFRQKAMVAEVLPEIMQNMVDSGKKIGFSDVKTIGKMQAWVKGELNDPAYTEYMTQRNDALMTIAGVMRGLGMTDQAHRAEIEVSAPTMSPDALDAWMRGQMKSLEPRLKINRTITRSDRPEPGASATAPQRIANDADYNALPSGATFIAPDGSTRKKP